MKTAGSLMQEYFLNEKETFLAALFDAAPFVRRLFFNLYNWTTALAALRNLKKGRGVHLCISGIVILSNADSSFFQTKKQWGHKKSKLITDQNICLQLINHKSMMKTYNLISILFKNRFSEPYN